MEWSDVHEGEPIHVWFTTEELIAVLERNMQRLERNRGRLQYGGFGSRMEEEEWLRRRRVNIERLRHAGEAEHYMALYPSPVEG